MPPGPSRSLAHRAAEAGGNTPEHKRFRALADKIEKARERLRHWQEQGPLFAQAHAARVQPLLAQLNAQRRDWAFELERVLLGRRWAQADAALLAELIAETAAALLDEADPPDAELKALYNRVSDVDYDTQAGENLADMKAMFEQMTGVDLGDEPIESANELMQRTRAGMSQAFARAQAEIEAKAPQAARPRKGRASAAAKRAEQEAQAASQNLREVYRKLAAALHPDRAPAGATEAQRRKRTESMARANAAYEAGDLLALLGLQLEIEQIDAEHAAKVAASQVKHFNRVLAEQLSELEAEADARQQALCAGFGIMVRNRLDPLKLETLLRDMVRDVQAMQLDLERQRRALRGPVAQARNWLRGEREARRMEDGGSPFPF